MLIKKPDDIRPSEITPKQVYLDRRRFLREMGVVAGSGLLLPLAADAGQKLHGVRKSVYRADEKLTDYKYVTTYNNFYEFGTDKSDPVKHSQNFRSVPWTVMVDGEVKRPARYQIEDLLQKHPPEERVYRLRCVEAWSMVIPWIGFPLADLIKRVEPTSRAKYVEFTTLHDPAQMPGQRPGLLGAGLDWPYIEGLRLDEAMHPLTLLAVGLYGEVLPNQNGAPIRLVVPWKYGFKSIKSIVRIRFVEKQPATTWAKASSRWVRRPSINATGHPSPSRVLGHGALICFAGRGRPAVRRTPPAHNGSTPREARLPRTTRHRFALPGAQREYGFYSNVNPAVDHPRWSQAAERRIGEDSLFSPKRKTLPFNGYVEQVASLYAGMDLKKFF